MPAPRRYRWFGLLLLVAGWAAAAFVYARTSGDDDGDALGYVVEGGTVTPVKAADSKGYERQLERMSGKTGVLAAEFMDWLAGLWRGRRLAYTLAVLSTAGASVCLFLSYFQLLDSAPPPAPRKP